MLINYDEWKLEASPEGKPEKDAIFKIPVSSCCGASPANAWDKITDRCSKCKEHCDYVYEDER